jgi:hypothetical protein
MPENRGGAKQHVAQRPVRSGFLGKGGVDFPGLKRSADRLAGLAHGGARFLPYRPPRGAHQPRYIEKRNHIKVS